MREFKSFRQARMEYEKVERTARMPFEQWLFDTVVDENEISDAESAAVFLAENVHLSARRESFWVIPLNAAHKPICAPVTVSAGLLNGTPAGAREVFAPAIWWDASCIVVAHNHPSGDPTPSKKDLALTEELLAASRILRIPLLDHIIVGSKHELFVSLRNDGYVDFENKKTRKGKRR